MENPCERKEQTKKKMLKTKSLHGKLRFGTHSDKAFPPVDRNSTSFSFLSFLAKETLEYFEVGNVYVKRLAKCRMKSS